MSSVKKFAKDIIDTEKELHILVNNAGIVGPGKKELSNDGFEITMATNHFGHFLLTNMLLDLLKASAPSRIVTVSSIAHGWTTVYPDDLNYEKKKYPSRMVAYSQSKLCNILFTVELADRLSGTGVTANCVHPGFVGTEIAQKSKSTVFMNIFLNVTWLISKFLIKNAEMGAQTTNFVAVAEEVENISGEYFVDCKIESTTLMAKDRALAKKVWEVSEKLVKLAPEDIQYKGKVKTETEKQD